jgi:hypothetical protein
MRGGGTGAPMRLEIFRTSFATSRPSPQDSLDQSKWNTLACTALPLNNPLIGLTIGAKLKVCASD